MNWYKNKITKIAKHVSGKSHYCGLCGTFLKPRFLSKTPRHYFPWGIMYTCECGNSSIWTNSVRNHEEFKKVVLQGVPLDDIFGVSGFCNDIFCGECFKNIIPLKNGLWFIDKNPIAIIQGETKDDYSLYRIMDLEKYIRDYIRGKRDFNPEYMGEEINLDRDFYGQIHGVDIYGCSSKDHNLAIVHTKSENEYGEGEYKPIYNWIIENKNKIPQQMIKEL